VAPPPGFESRGALLWCGVGSDGRDYLLLGETTQAILREDALHDLAAPLVALLQLDERAVSRLYDRVLAHGCKPLRIDVVVAV
jgi:hypothetical protein